jgi:hypothetical protein
MQTIGGKSGKKAKKTNPAGLVEDVDEDGMVPTDEDHLGISN